MKTKLCDLFGIEEPIFQGGMAWVSDANLASAVSEAGGLGIIAAGNGPADFVRGEIQKARVKTKKPFGVNIMLLSPYVDEVIKVVCEEKVKIVVTGAGNPGKYMEQFKAAGISVVPVVPSVAIAKHMEKLGADAVIAEGLEAGGHIGKLTTMALVPQVVDAVSIPVIAAGGIGDGRGIAASFMLGASGVQMGTRFLLAHECTVHENYKKMVEEAGDIDTVETGRCTGHPVRVLRNKLTRKIQQVEELSKAEAVEQIEKLGTGALRLAVKDGDVDNGSVMCGQIAGMLSKRQSAKEIIAECIAETQKLLGRGV